MFEYIHSQMQVLIESGYLNKSDISFLESLDKFTDKYKAIKFYQSRLESMPQLVDAVITVKRPTDINAIDQSVARIIHVVSDEEMPAHIPRISSEIRTTVGENGDCTVTVDGTVGVAYWLNKRFQQLGCTTSLIINIKQ